MRLRFLEMVDSAVPGLPFVPGQIIEVAELTEQMQAWLSTGDGREPRAELVKDEPERAVTAARETAVLGRKRAREHRGTRNHVDTQPTRR